MPPAPATPPWLACGARRGDGLRFERGARPGRNASGRLPGCGPPLSAPRCRARVLRLRQERAGHGPVRGGPPRLPPACGACPPRRPRAPGGGPARRGPGAASVAAGRRLRRGGKPRAGLLLRAARARPRPATPRPHRHPPLGAGGPPTPPGPAPSAARLRPRPGGRPVQPACPGGPGSRQSGPPPRRPRAYGAGRGKPRARPKARTPARNAWPGSSRWTEGASGCTSPGLVRVGRGRVAACPLGHASAAGRGSARPTRGGTRCTGKRGVPGGGVYHASGGNVKILRNAILPRSL